MSDDGKQSCSFCGKSQDEVSVLIAGTGAHICEECVARSVDMLKQKGIWPSAVVWLYRAIRHRLARRRESN